MGTIEIKNRDILLDGKSVKIHSGAMHYFRIHPDYWRDRIVKLRQCGLNCLETYMCWNRHEPRLGQFDFSGWLDIERYIQMAQEEGLLVMVRPGPYICSEWDLGGQPSWLLKDPQMRLRTLYEGYWKYAKRYMDEVLSRLKKWQYTEGGPLIMMQIENEYGSYGDDHEYLEAYRQCYVEHGFTIPLFTADGNTPHHLASGTVPGTMACVDGRCHPARLVKELNEFNPDNPPFVMELWNGVAFHWQEQCREHLAEDVRGDIKEALANGVNFNLYMFHGGTNFGFMNGANGGNCPYKPLITSYDVNGTLNEEGDPTPKYYAVQEELCKAQGIPIEKPVILPKKAYGKIELTESVSLYDALPALGQWKDYRRAPRMEEIDQDYGFIMYRYRLTVPGAYPVELFELRDRAIIFVNGVPAGTLYRNDPQPHRVMVTIPEGGADVDVLVENMGRINYGYLMNQDCKGILFMGIAYTMREMSHLKAISLPMNDISGITYKPFERINGPAFYRGHFHAETVCDTFIKIPGGMKGNVWLNGFNLGRYWNVGPQLTLYAPAPLLKKGRNEVVVFELHGMRDEGVESVDKRDFGVSVPMKLP